MFDRLKKLFGFGKSKSTGTSAPAQRPAPAPVEVNRSAFGARLNASMQRSAAGGPRIGQHRQPAPQPVVEDVASKMHTDSINQPGLGLSSTVVDDDWRADEPIFYNPDNVCMAPGFGGYNLNEDYNGMNFGDYGYGSNVDMNYGGAEIMLTPEWQAYCKAFEVPDPHPELSDDERSSLLSLVDEDLARSQATSENTPVRQYPTMQDMPKPQTASLFSAQVPAKNPAADRSLATSQESHIKQYPIMQDMPKPQTASRSPGYPLPLNPSAIKSMFPAAPISPAAIRGMFPAAPISSAAVRGMFPAPPKSSFSPAAIRAMFPKAPTK